ncbi:HD domain-containing protein [Rapidithrix thailandica]|uniref:HD domain-containing protein n=1 Tax=Rapidithrix thailandica TaxID=413964 RepID=A0AAW9RUA7_9BACT
MKKSNWSPEIYRKAWHFASLAHQGQNYGGSQKDQYLDYLTHIGNVAMEVINALAQSGGLNGNLAIQCALLHDILEDTHHTFDELQQHFGEEVAHGVQALTKNKNLPSKEAQMADSLERIRQQPKEIWMVKMADRVTNLYQPPFYWNTEKKIAYREEAQVIYQTLSQANEVLAKRLTRKIEEYQQFFNN